MISDPQLDLIVKDADGNEYPCKKDIFFATYEATPAIQTDSVTACYKFTKKALSTLVPIPENVGVEIETLEGVLPKVSFPDYICIGA